MCGIFAYRGQQNAVKMVVDGLKRLEYRGYDSWGVVTQSGHQLAHFKQVGKISAVSSAADLHLPLTQVAVAHTRWATHGGVTKINAHPHLSNDESFAVVHNGVVENFQELKAELLGQNEPFFSETDTEVIVRLLERALQSQPDMLVAIRQVYRRIKGRNSICILTSDGTIFAVRQGSPFIVGFGKDKTSRYVSSDVLSFAEYVDQVVTLENGQMVCVYSDGKTNFFETTSGQSFQPKPQPLTLKQTKIDKEGYPHFMVKELHEIPAALRTVAAQPDKIMQDCVNLIRAAQRVFVIGSGTAGVAANQTAFFLRTIAHIPAVSLVGADANDYLAFMDHKSVVIAPSQSGETADVLEVLEAAKQQGAKIVVYVNMPASSMTRLADVVSLAEAGPEICVMSTKILSSQFGWGYLLAHAVADQLVAARAALLKTADIVQAYLENKHQQQMIHKIAQFLLDKEHIFLLAKGQLLTAAQEGMIKIVEASYHHAHAIPAGDLKHYAITLIQPGVPVLVFVAEDTTHHDVINAAHEVKTRGATVIGLSASNESCFDYHLAVPGDSPLAAVTSVLPIQLIAYHMAVLLGNDVDHPRNIAKSVTVK